MNEHADKGGFTKIDHVFSDRIFPTLIPRERIVFERLLRQTHGYNKTSVQISVKKISEKTNLSARTVGIALNGLVGKNLITRTKVCGFSDIYSIVEQRKDGSNFEEKTEKTELDALKSIIVQQKSEIDHLKSLLNENNVIKLSSKQQKMRSPNGEGDPPPPPVKICRGGMQNLQGGYAESAGHIKENIKKNNKPSSNLDLVNINIGHLKRVGLDEDKISKIIYENKLDPDIVQKSLEAFCFDLFENRKEKSIRNPVAYIMKVLRNGDTYPYPSNYISEKEREEEKERIIFEEKKNEFEERKSLKLRAINTFYSEFKKNNPKKYELFLNLIEKETSFSTDKNNCFSSNLIKIEAQSKMREILLKSENFTASVDCFLRRFNCAV